MTQSRAQEKMARLENLSNADLLERAWQEISALCGSDGRPRKWRMSIPVDADRDSDVLFGEVLKRFAQLEERLEEIARIVANRGIPPKHEVALGQLLTIGRIALGDKEESSVASNDSPE